jgi:hypothetical protein
VARPRSGASNGQGAPSTAGSQAATVTRSAGGVGSTGNARARGSQPIVGQAQARRAYLPGSPSRPGFGHYPDYPYYSHYPYYPYYGHRYYPYYPSYPYYPWYGYYDPWYGGYGFNFGFSIGFGYSPWHHYPYGAYGVPYFYAPYPVYGYAGGSYSDDGSSTGGGAYSADVQPDNGNSRRPTPTGSVRFRANPRHARVYVDGALVGTVDEFDGLGNHLEIEAGRHQIELRADGYESYSSEVAVQARRTVTERATLKKIN